jgi:hypothetical protein
MAVTTIDIGKLVSITIPEKQVIEDADNPVDIAKPPVIGDVDFGFYDMSQYNVPNKFGTPQMAPISIKRTTDAEDSWYTFPVEPMIGISGGSNVIMRDVLKMPVSAAIPRRGTIKERWAQKDWTISIDGLITTTDNPLGLPVEDIATLLEYCQARVAIDVKCPLFAPLGIHRMVITNFDFPFTKGVENQSYHIEAVSDDDWELLINLKNFNS